MQMCEADACLTSQFVSTSDCLHVNALSSVCRAGITKMLACKHVSSHTARGFHLTQQEVFISHSKRFPIPKLLRLM